MKLGPIDPKVIENSAYPGAEDDPLWRSRLTWLATHQPEELERQFREDPEKLRDQIDRKVIEALWLVQGLKDQGVPEADANEQVLREFVAPLVEEEEGPEGDQPPKRISPQFQKELDRWYGSLEPREPE